MRTKWAGPRARRGRRRRLVVGSVVGGGCLLVAACGADEATAPRAATTTTAPAAETGSTTSIAADELDVRISDPLSEPSPNFGESDNGSLGHLAFTEDAYQIAIVGRPFFSPLQDRGAAGLTSAEMSVEVTMVSGRGTAGFTCGLSDDRSSYMLAVGRNDLGETSVAVAYYEMPGGRPVSVSEARPGEGIRHLELPPLGEPMTVGATCEPGEGADEVLLAMTLDGREVIRLTGDRGRPEGQVGLFAWGQGPQQLVADFRDLTVSGSLASAT